MDTIQAAPNSVIDHIVATVLIESDTHKDLWNVPRVVTDPNDPSVGVLSVNVADRHGKDKSFGRHYFVTQDGFETIDEVSEKPERFLRIDRRLIAGHPLLPGPPGHQFTCPYVRVDDDRVLKIFTVKGEDGKNYTTSAICRVADEGLEPIAVGNTHTIADSRRGLYEPHTVYWRERWYATARSEDGRGYRLESEDGLTWSEPNAWTWDDGTPVAMDQTMTKLIAHPDGLVLVYTRVRDDNMETFRHRAPLHVADLDAERRLIRDTERVIVPNRGLAVGNFWVWPRGDREHLVTTAEWPRDGRETNGDIWLCRIVWKR